jgi:hypothetical protein
MGMLLKFDVNTYPTLKLMIYGKPKSQLIWSGSPPSRNYPTAESLCKALNRLLRPHKVAFSLLEEGAEKLFQVETLPQNMRIVLKQGMNYILGYRATELTKSGAVADFRADLKRGTTAMMIYCSLCEPTLVGDNQVPLLRIAHLTTVEQHGAVVNQTFDPPIHIPVNRGGGCMVNTIEIDIRTDSGESFPLSQDGKVLLTLHFRRQRA